MENKTSPMSYLFIVLLCAGGLYYFDYYTKPVKPINPSFEVLYQEYLASDQNGQAEPLFTLASRLNKYDTTDEDKAKAAKFFRLAADMKHRGAMSVVALQTAKPHQALELNVHKAAFDLHNEIVEMPYDFQWQYAIYTAKYYIGRYYETGAAGERNISKAKKWYQQAALEGGTRADLKLANIYNSGTGGTVDKVKAYTHYVLARTAFGNAEDVPRFMKEYRSKMTNAQIAEGNKLVKDARAKRLALFKEQKAKFLLAHPELAPKPVSLTPGPKSNN